MRFFKQTMGMPFTTYLNDYRLTLAAKSLLETHKAVLEIASECGFDNLSYFNRIFKKNTALHRGNTGRGSLRYRLRTTAAIF